MFHLKMIFGLGLAAAVLLLAVVSPSDTLARFDLPSGCCDVRVEAHGPACHACVNNGCGWTFDGKRTAR